MWVYKNQPNNRDNVEGRRNTRPVVYDIEYPLQLPENHCNDLRPVGSFRNPPIIGESSLMTESSRMRAEANMRNNSSPIPLINNTRTRVMIRKEAANLAISANRALTSASSDHMEDKSKDTMLDKTTDFIQQNKAIGGLSTYAGLLATKNTLFQHPQAKLPAGQLRNPHLRAVPGNQANKWRLGFPGISDYVQMAQGLPGINKINPKYFHHGGTIKAPEVVNKGLNRIATGWGGLVKKYPTALGKVVPGFNAVANAAPLIQLGSMGVDFISGKHRRRQTAAQASGAAVNNVQNNPQM